MGARIGEQILGGGVGAEDHAFGDPARSLGAGEEPPHHDQPVGDREQQRAEAETTARIGTGNVQPGDLSRVGCERRIEASTAAVPSVAP